MSGPRAALLLAALLAWAALFGWPTPAPPPDAALVEEIRRLRGEAQHWKQEADRASAVVARLRADQQAATAEVGRAERRYEAVRSRAVAMELPPVAIELVGAADSLRLTYQRALALSEAVVEAQEVAVHAERERAQALAAQVLALERRLEDAHPKGVAWTCGLTGLVGGAATLAMPHPWTGAAAALTTFLACAWDGGVL